MKNKNGDWYTESNVEISTYIIRKKTSLSLSKVEYKDIYVVIYMLVSTKFKLFEKKIFHIQVLFSTWVFFHRHWWFTGLHDKTLEPPYSFLPRPIANISYISLHFWNWDDYLALSMAINYQPVTWWDLPFLGISKWLIWLIAFIAWLIAFIATYLSQANNDLINMPKYCKQRLSNTWCRPIIGKNLGEILKIGPIFWKNE